jgi:PPP4R2
MMSAASVASLSSDNHGNIVDADSDFISSPSVSRKSPMNYTSTSSQPRKEFDPETAASTRNHDVNENKVGQQEQTESHVSGDGSIYYTSFIRGLMNKPPESLASTVPENGNSNVEATLSACQSVLFTDDVLQILKEVASKGTSSVLPWSYDRKQPQELNRVSDGVHSNTNTSKLDRSLTHDTSKIHHNSRRNGAQKRTRLSLSSRSNRSVSDRKHPQLHRSFYSNNRRSTTTATMVVQPSTSAPSSISKGFQSGTHAVASTTSNLFVVRTQSSHPFNHPSSGSLFSPGSAGSGRTSGSEHEDTSQYECDSEGTSATSNSEISFGSNRANERHGSFSKRGGLVGHKDELRSLSSMASKRPSPLKYTSVRDTLRSALSLVLDYYYRNHGGYKLSPAEKQRYSVVADATKTSSSENNANEKKSNVEDIFHNRKKLLLDMLGRYCNTNLEQTASGLSSIPSFGNNLPPFTVQRVAEVLMEPERYYTQTHKLCNCLEKLLLVTSSAGAFGGNVGGDTPQTRREESEIVALSEEKTRLRSEFRQSHRRTRRKTQSSVSDDIAVRKDSLYEVNNSNEAQHVNNSNISNATNGDIGYGVEEGDDESLQQSTFSDETCRDALEAAARASLRTKFDHVGIDPHSPAAIANSRDVFALVESRRMTSSPPPPSLGHGGLLRTRNHGSPPSPSSPEVIHPMSCPRVASPVLFNAGGGGGYDGLSSSPPMAPILANHTSMQFMQMHPSATSRTVASNVLGSGMMASVSGPTFGFYTRDADVESRSPASSDLDSESDFDDSASDRSDGSDSGVPYEPLTAARAMALNRLQQQTRMQSRVLTPFQVHSSNNNVGQEGFRPSADYEYQSGDSLDSTRAEESGGSDSSSSDHAD